MSVVTFTQTENGSASVNVTGNIVYETDFYLERLNHFVLPLPDGTEQVFDVGPTKIYGLLVMKNVSKTDKSNFVDWLEDDIIFSKNKFTIASITGIDLGLGENTAVTNCRFMSGNSSKDIFDFRPPGIYTLKFKYMLVMP